MCGSTKPCRKCQCLRFGTAGKIYFFDPGRLNIKKGDHVIVETARGIEYGTVVGGVKEVEDDKVVQPLKPVLRIATQKNPHMFPLHFSNSTSTVRKRPIFLSGLIIKFCFILRQTEGLISGNW